MHTFFKVLVVTLFHKDLGSELTLTAGVTGVVEVNPVCHFLAGKTNFVGVDDDDIIATFHEGRVARFVFAAENKGGNCAHASENLIGCIDYNPFAFYALRVRHLCLVA